MLHAPTFMEQYNSSAHRRNPSFVALVLSICCLSSRYAQDHRLAKPDASGSTITSNLLHFARETVSSLASQRADLEIVQALFNMSVVQEGTSRPSLLWVYLSQALSWVPITCPAHVIAWRSTWDCTVERMCTARFRLSTSKFETGRCGLCTARTFRRAVLSGDLHYYV
jgi:hypothetical protein